MDNLEHYITNKTYDEIKIGDIAKLTRTLTMRDIKLFAIVTGDMNPAHLDEEYANTDVFHQIIGHGIWTASMFSVLLGMQLPGPGTLYLDQSLKFLKPVHLNDTITASVKVIKKDDEHKFITFETLCIDEEGNHLLEGEALILAPSEKVSWKKLPLPEIEVTPNQNELNAKKAISCWINEGGADLLPVNQSNLS